MAMPKDQQLPSRGVEEHPVTGRPHSGLLIAFVGIDGCGKGTQIELLKQKLIQKGLEDRLVLCKQPGGTPVGLEIRRILFETVGSKNMSPLTYQILCTASHVEACTSVIQPALDAGKIVICDRWHPYCAPAYNPEYKFPLNTVEPDVVFHLYGLPSVFLNRALRRTTESHQQTKLWNTEEKLGQIQGRYYAQLENLKSYVPFGSDRGTPEFIATHLWDRLRRYL